MEYNLDDLDLIYKRNNHHKYRRRREESSKCYPASDWKWMNQDGRAERDKLIGQEREGNRDWKHAGIIPTCSKNEKQKILTRIMEIQSKGIIERFQVGKSRAKTLSGNLVFTKHLNDWHPGLHSEYG